jgi:hypothetical protein
VSLNMSFFQKAASDLIGIVIDVRAADPRMLVSKRRRQIYACAYISGYLLMNYGDVIAIKLAPIRQSSDGIDVEAVQSGPEPFTGIVLDGRPVDLDGVPTPVTAYESCEVCDHERWQHTSKSSPDGFVHPCRSCDCPEFVRLEADVAEPADDGA